MKMTKDVLTKAVAAIRAKGLLPLLLHKADNDSALIAYVEAFEEGDALVLVSATDTLLQTTDAIVYFNDKGEVKEVVFDGCAGVFSFLMLRDANTQIGAILDCLNELSSCKDEAQKIDEYYRFILDTY